MRRYPGAGMLTGRSINTLVFMRHIVVLLLFLNGLTYSQQRAEYFIRSYTVDQGLPNNHIRSITQDRDGFIWVATWDAVARYDGYEFINYYHVPEDSSTIPGVDLKRILVDARNNVWVCSPYKLSRYDRQKDCFQPYNLRNGKADEDTIWDIALDRHGRFWAGGCRGLLEYSLQDDHFYLRPACGPGMQIKKLDPGQIAFDNKDDLWIFSKSLVTQHTMLSSGEGPCVFQQVASYEIKGINYQFENFHACYSVIRSADDDKTLIASNLGLLMYDPREGSFSPACQDVLPCFRDVKEITWDREGKEFVYVRNSSIQYQWRRTEHIPVETWFNDRNGNLWLGLTNNYSEGIGLRQVVFTPRPFRHYFTEKETGMRLAVFGIHRAEDSTLYIGCPEKECFFRSRKDGVIENLSHTVAEGVKKDYQLRSFLECKGKLLLGFQKALLVLFDPVAMKGKKISGSGSRAFLRDISSFKLMVRDRRDNIVIAGRHHVTCFDRELSRVLFHHSDPSKDYYSILEDEEGQFWLGSSGLLTCFDRNFGHGREYVIAEGKYNIESIAEGDKGELWLALYGGGICRFDKATGRQQRYSSEEGLYNNSVYNLIKDGRGRLWMSTNHGISMFDPVREQFSNFGPVQGLMIDEFNADAVWQGDDGEMIFGGIGGVVSFYPDSVTMPGVDYFSPLVVTGILVDGVQACPDVYQTDSIGLSEGSNNFTLTFARLDYMNADKIRYRYKMEGVDRDWDTVDFRHRVANYLNLKPGRYHFRVEATDATGRFNTNRELAIFIPPRLAQTTGFKVASIGVGLMMIILLVLAIIRYIRRKEKRLYHERLREQQLKLAQLRLESLRGQLHPHFLNNTMNLINLQIYSGNKEEANSMLSDLSVLLKGYIGNSESEFISLGEEIENLGIYLRFMQMRHANRFTFSIERDATVPDVDLGCEIYRYMIQPFAENAVKHGMAGLKKPGGNIKIYFTRKKPHSITCFIEDNGVGRKHASRDKGKTEVLERMHGSKIVEERLAIINEMHHEDFRIILSDLETGVDETGTRVEIDLPVKEKR